MVRLTARWRPSGVFYGWWVLAAASAMSFLAGGIFFRGFNAFLIPVRDSLGLSQAQVALVFSIARAEGGMGGPFSGWLIDRFGARSLVMGGVLLAAAGYFAFSQVDSFLGFALVYLLMISLGASTAFQQALFAAINKWFIRRRGLVVMLFGAASALGGAVLVPVLTLIADKLGWQEAAIFSGGAFVVVALPLSLAIRSTPESMGLRPDGEDVPARPAQPASATSGVSGTRVAPVVEPDFTLGQALRTSAFWLLLMGLSLRQIVIVAVFVNLVSILVDWRGESTGATGGLIGVMLAISLVARLGISVVADRLSKKHILAVSMAMEVAAMLVLVLSGSVWALYAFVLLAGIGDGGWVIGWVLLADFFGRRRFATLRGLVAFSHSWALVVAPFLMGWWFDRKGSYDVQLWAAFAFMLAAVACIAVLRRPRPVRAR